ncbi:MAG: hypothetical protein ACM3ZQ_10975 [Bacillota bacterium]
MDRRVYVNGKFFDRSSLTPEEMATSMHAKVERVEKGFDGLLGDHEIVYLKME